MIKIWISLDVHRAGWTLIAAIQNIRFLGKYGLWETIELVKSCPRNVILCVSVTEADFFNFWNKAGYEAVEILACSEESEDAT